MSTNELAAKLKLLAPEQRRIVELLVEALVENAPGIQRDLKGHRSFGAWADRTDLPADSDAASRELRKRAARRERA
jgi:hypothetical protein